MNSKKKQLLNKTYQQFMEIGLSSNNISRLKNIVDPNVMGIGTAADEKMFTLLDLRELLKRQKKQTKGLKLSWKTKPLSRHIADDENSAVFVDDLFLNVVAGQETIKMYMRFSVVLEYKNEKWIVVHWHGSKPENVQSEEDTYGIENWKQKAAELEKLVKERTGELVAKNRELEIESVLERVRTVAMSMTRPDDMLKVCRVISDELSNFGVKAIRNIQTVIIREEKQVYLCYQYFAAYKKSIVEDTYYQKNPVEKELVTKMLDVKGGYFEGSLKGKKLQQFRNHRKKENFLPDPKLDKSKEIFYYMYSIGEAALGITLYEDLKENERILFKRLHQVFTLAYKRFRDIEQAEAQAREAQIQLALERVRARTMAMQKSDELTEVAELLFKQVNDLGIKTWTTGFNVWSDDNKFYTDYITNPQGGFMPPYTIDAGILPISIELSTAKKRGDEFFVNYEEGEALAETYRQLSKFGEKQFKGILESGFEFPSHQYEHFVFGSKVSLMFITYDSVPEVHDIFKRFGKVFEQTYTRFLDLQKAEEQAREAEIELALERVRARTMAMQKSEELQDVVHTLFERLKDLNIEFYTAIIVLFKEDSKDIIWWLENKEKQRYSRVLVPYTDIAYLRDLFDARKNERNYFSKTYFLKEKNELYNHLFSATDFRHVSEKQKKFLLDAESATMSVAIAKNTGIHLTRYNDNTFSEADNEILKRFVKVFEQSYTRFLDLQKAEAQAREAQIEAALERVRSRSMAMHKSDELKEVIRLVLEQFVHLKINAEHAGFYIDYKAQDDMHIWLADPNLEPFFAIIPYFDTPTWNSFLEAKTKGIAFHTDLLDFEEKNKFYNSLFKLFTIPEEAKEFYLQCKGLAVSTVLLDNVGLYIENFEGIPYSDEENKILMRFGKVFQQTYTRFLDLQKAEAQAREAQIEAALERVRSRTLAMQKSEELAETSAVLFQQLIHLGISPNRLYISIVKDDTGETEFWITDEDGSKVSMAYQDNLNNNPSFKKMYDGWKQQAHLPDGQEKSLVIDMKDEELQEYLKYLSSIHVPFKGGLSQKRRVQYLAYFSKGFIGMASPEPQPAETLQLLERFAYVFNLTFTRFNDLQIAEAHALQAEQDLIAIKAARKKAEETLTELQATQKQLIQSEKMASLGELTAGIAHEIQNPLNFVNNFSDVNKEMLEELKAERLKPKTEQDEQLKEDLINDVITNSEKINLHGKRAADIVKGMLQHSRKSEGKKEPTDINVLCDEYLRLSYHGLRAKDKSFNAEMKTDFDNLIGKINIIPQDIGRVLLNLYNNAFYAVAEKKKLSAQGLPTFERLATLYEPIVSVNTKKIKNSVLITVSDNGNGIPKNIVDKIFQPFFTTKPTGSGTGLGLSLSYDIVKAHGGEIKVESREGEGSKFLIQLPVI